MRHADEAYTMILIKGDVAEWRSTGPGVAEQDPQLTKRLDEDLVDHFLNEADRSGGSLGYQTLINDALRQHVGG